MAERAEQFLASFNRIEKWMQDELGNPHNMGFSELVRRLDKQHNPEISNAADDLLQMARLRNAIVHDQVDEDFVIAEPNEWTVKRITEIEQHLTKPEHVLPKFAKRVTGFEDTLPITEILETIAKKGYSQFPLYHQGQFKGLITLRALGYWFARESLKGDIHLEGRIAADLILKDGKSTNYRFVSGEALIIEVKQFFENDPLLEAVLITKNGDPDGNLVGIIRPRDLFHKKERNGQ